MVVAVGTPRAGGAIVAGASGQLPSALKTSVKKLQTRHHRKSFSFLYRSFSFINALTMKTVTSYSLRTFPLRLPQARFFFVIIPC